MAQSQIKYKPKKQTPTEKKDTGGNTDGVLPLRLLKIWLTIALTIVNSMRANPTVKK